MPMHRLMASGPVCSADGRTQELWVHLLHRCCLFAPTSVTGRWWCCVATIGAACGIARFSASSRQLLSKLTSDPAAYGAPARQQFGTSRQDPVDGYTGLSKMPDQQRVSTYRNSLCGSDHHWEKHSSGSA